MELARESRCRHGCISGLGGHLDLRVPGRVVAVLQGRIRDIIEVESALLHSDRKLM